MILLLTRTDVQLVTILVGQNKNVVEPKHGGIITCSFAKNWQGKHE